MEDYKEKYEQAMLRMNKWVEGSEITNPREVAEFVFPELRESDDERIRKFLYDFINNIPTEEWNKDKPNEDFRIAVLDWLEKQGEQKPAWSEEDEDMIDLLVNILEINHPNDYFKANQKDEVGIIAVPTKKIISWLKSIKERMKGE